MDIAIIGGGAAGFFFAANASALYPDCAFTIYEQGSNVLQKVKISGGGRCNLTNSISDPRQLVTHYPRGEKELLGPFYGFSTDSTQQWVTDRSVSLKTEADGRVFPVSNSSQTIIDCLVNECTNHKVAIHTKQLIRKITPVENGRKGFVLEDKSGTEIHADKVFIGTGSNKSIWRQLETIGHTIVPPVFSLFTFQIDDARISDLAGVSVHPVKITIPETNFCTEGPFLITHKGISGPAVLKLSAFAARYFFQKAYKTTIQINFLPSLTNEQLKQIRQTEGSSLIKNHRLFRLPKRLFANLIDSANINEQLKWASVSNTELDTIFSSLCEAEFEVVGQNRFKEEFVTAGGVKLSEIDFTNFSSRKITNLYLAGEILNIDAVTGGFNFQSAWTGAYLAAVGLFD